MPMAERARSHRRTGRYRPRTAEYAARALLRTRGFSIVARVVEPSLPLSLAAWSGDGRAEIFRVMTTRRALPSVSEATILFWDEIGTLRALSRDVGGPVNLWVLSDRKAWHRYRVFPGGVMEVQDA